VNPALATPIDWGRPWLAPLRDAGLRVLAQVSSGASVAQALNMVSPRGVVFVPYGSLPRDEAYEAFIARTLTVPTRDNLHDLFNGLVWLRHPALKRHLNTLQARAIESQGIGPTRGPVRDALTLFDEYGALWPAAPAAMRAALSAHDWAGLFIAQRAGWPGAEPEIFGHALLEQLARAPRKALTAHVLTADPLPWPASAWGAKPFMPMPVLGVPGWWPANERPDFYADDRVFRPHRRRTDDAPAAAPDLATPLLNLAPQP
jgi:Protein of unknown function (DUF3025)